MRVWMNCVWITNIQVLSIYRPIVQEPSLSNFQKYSCLQHVHVCCPLKDVAEFGQYPDSDLTKYSWILSSGELNELAQDIWNILLMLL